jgi:hypothetical protein
MAVADMEPKQQEAKELDDGGMVFVRTSMPDGKRVSLPLGIRLTCEVGPNIKPFLWIVCALG